MHFTDIFIRRPVLACVVSLMILVIGYKAFTSLPILEYPKTENAVVTVTTTYYGADPQTVAGFVTTLSVQAGIALRSLAAGRAEPPGPPSAAQTRPRVSSSNPREISRARSKHSSTG